MKTIGVIGLGSIGLRHARNLKALGHHVWGYDPDMKKRLEHGFDLCGSRIEDIMEADAIVIASPTKFHAEHINMALSYDHLPNIFVEKPISDFMPIPAIAEKLTHSWIMVGYNLRFHSCVKKAKEWVDAGFLGEPLWGNFTVGQFNDKPDYLRDGVILNWSHEIDLALHLLGRGSVAGSSTRLNNGRDDITDILLTHDNGCRSYIHLDYVTQPEIRQSIVVGSEATIIMDLIHREAWLRAKSGIMLDHHALNDSWDENYYSEMEAFINRVDGKKTIGCTGEEALAVLEVCLSVRKQAGL